MAAINYLVGAMIMCSTLIQCTRTESATSYDQSESDNNLCDSLIAVNKNELAGVWGEDTLKNAAFVFEGDSIRYMEHYDTPYFFEVKDDSILIHLDGFNSFWKICRLRNDSLVLVDEYGETSYYKKLYSK